MSVHNLMEDIVKTCLKELLVSRELQDQCDDKSQSDIMAIALNKLPPKYVSTDKGEIFVKTQDRSQVETDVYRELSFAMDRVLNTSRNSILDKD